MIQAVDRRRRSRDLLGGLVSLALLGALMVGVPIVLARNIGWPLPRGHLSTAVAWHALASPLPDTFWPKALGLVGWIVWGWLALGVSTEAIDSARRRTTSGFRGARISRRITGRLVVKVVLAIGIAYGLLVHGTSAGASEHQVVSNTRPVPAASPTLQFVEQFGFGFSAAGALFALDRLRRAQQRYRSVGAAIAMPGPDLVPVERKMRAGISQPPEAVDEVLRVAVNGADVAPTEWARPDRREQPEVEVAVLGPVEVRGAVREFTRARSLDLVVFLAFHPGGVEREVWAEVMWPGRQVPRQTLDSTVSVARSALGSARDGSRHFPTGRGRLRLGPGVSSDWERFVALARQEVALAEQDGRTVREEALGLIRGRPFEGLKNVDWTLYEGVAATMESHVVDLASRHAIERLDSGDAGAAEWACRQGLKVSPYDERLYRALMQAADAAGNRVGVVAIMDELRSVVYEGVEPFDGVHPETEELYCRLTGASELRGTRRGWARSRRAVSA